MAILNDSVCKLIDVMAARKLRAVDLARSGHVSRHAVHDVVCRRKELTPDLLAKIAKALDVPVDELRGQS